MKNKTKEIYSIDKAILEIEKRIKSLKKPVFVGVFSAGQNVGKSYFISKSIDYFQNKFIKEKGFGIYVATSDNENPFTNTVIKENYKNLEILFFHCGLNSYQPSKEFDISSWNRNLEYYGLKRLDINVVIYNPKIIKPSIDKLIEDFDMVIVNVY